MLLRVYLARGKSSFKLHLKSQLSPPVQTEHQHIARAFQIRTGDSHRCSGQSSHLGSHFPSESRFSGGLRRCCAGMMIFSKKSEKFSLMKIANHRYNQPKFRLISVGPTIKKSENKKLLLSLLLIF
jgi:hypothetical protein